MPRGLCLFTIVAAFQLHAAAQSPVSEDAPITRDVVVRAHALGIDAARNRARFLPETARLLLTPNEWRSAVPAGAEEVPLDVEDAPAGLTVPVPLTAAIWSQAVFGREVPAGDLVATILLDRHAMLLAYTLSALDDETLAYLAEHPLILGYFYQNSPEVFGAFGSSLRISGGRVRTPGGEDGARLWEAALGVGADEPDRFILALYGAYTSRIAYLYDTIAELDPPHASFALGLRIQDPAYRLARFRALVAFCEEAYPDWRLLAQPLSRPQNDLALLLARLKVGPSGEPLPPARRAFWASVLDFNESISLSPDTAALSAPDDLVDAAWLAAATNGQTWFARGDRFDQVAFGQRVFADVSDQQAAHAISTLKVLPRQKMLFLALERMGIRQPELYAATSMRVAALKGDPSSVFWTQAQLQGALVLIERMTEVGTIDSNRATALVTSLMAVRGPNDTRFDGALARWFEKELLPLMPQGESVEARVISAMAGPPPGRGAPQMDWEGELYRLDFAAAERRRLEKVRAKQGGFTIDTALALEHLAVSFSPQPSVAAQVRTVAERLTGLAASVPRRSARLARDIFPPAVRAPRYGREWVEKTARELTSVVKDKKSLSGSGVTRVPGSLREIGDAALGEALLSFAYAASIGNPSGSALLGVNVALRHDFGFNIREGDARASRAWAVPRQEILPGEPWRITGSLLGLDIALAPLSLQRMELDRDLEVPRLTTTEREAFAVSRSLLNPRLLTDRDRDAIAAAVEAGRARVQALEPGADVESISAALDLDGWRRRALNWTVARDPEGIDSLFSLSDLLVLGGGASGANIDAWGMSALHFAGCACTRFVTSREWRVLSGHPQLAFMAASMPDLNLRIAMGLRDLQVPAALAPPVLEAAIGHFLERARPTDANDWWTLATVAREVTQNELEDYVASATAVDGPLVPITEEGEP